MADRYADRYQGAPARAEDDDYGHGTQHEASDPLAELARLIGQTDPFAGLPSANRGHATYAAEPEEVEEEPPAPPSWMQRVNHRPAAAPTYEQPAAYRPAAPVADEEADEASEFLHGARHSADDYQQGYADPSRYDDALYGSPDDPNYAPFSPSGEGYEGDPYADPQADIAREMPRARRGGMATVVVVAALGIVGTAGAYAYRTLVGAPRSGEAPIIRADAGPNKVLPPTQMADASKQVQDRLPAGQGSERLVSREEQPVDINAAAGQPRSGPRIVFPPLTTNPTAPPQADAAPPVAPARPAAAPGPNNGLGDARKVKVVAIRPDQPDAAAPPAAAPAPVPPPAAKPVATQRVAPPATAPAANAPMSLSPQSAAPAPTRVATTTPAAAPAGVAAGNYLVQVASQRSEADAQASYRALQSKYGSVLGSRSPYIKRVDLGDKGVYYRAMVGPFASSDEAAQFCGNLKSAGGQCVVQRN